MTFALMLLLPDEVLPLLLIAAGVCMVIGLRSIASGLIVFVLASVFLPVLLMPLIEVVPLWILDLLAFYLLFLLPFIAIATLSALVRPVLGRRASDAMAGELAASLVRWMLFVPIFILRLLFAGARNLWGRVV